jgi:lysophospholipase L1-like esterase
MRPETTFLTAYVNGALVSGQSVTFAIPPWVMATNLNTDGAAIRAGSGGVLFSASRGDFTVLLQSAAARVTFLRDFPAPPTSELRLELVVGPGSDGSHAAPRYQLIATCGFIANAQTTSDASSRYESRVRVKSPPVAVSDLQLLYPAYYLLSSGGGVETAVSNNLTIGAAIELDSPAKHAPAYFSGKLQGALDAGAGIIASDPIGIDLEPSTAFWVRSDFPGAAGLRVPTGRNAAINGESFVKSAEATTQIYGTGLLATRTTGTTGSNGIPGPIAIIGRAEKPVPAIAILNDSIAFGSGDASNAGIVAGGNYGFVPRGLQDVDGAGGMWPWIMIGRSSGNLSNFLTPDAPRRMALLHYCSHAIVQAGTNDLASQALAAAQDAARKVWAACRRRGLKVYQVLIFPRIAATTDSYASAAGQVPVTGFEAGGGKRDPFNAWVRACVADGTIDGLIDPNPFVEDSVHPGKWITNGAANYPTSDGVHPSTALHVLAAKAVTAVARTFTV